MTAVKYAGTWWNPSDPTRRVPGYLERDDGTWLLHTVGRLSTERPREGLSLMKPAILLGECSGRHYYLRRATLAWEKSPGWYRGEVENARQRDDQHLQTWSAAELLDGLLDTDLLSSAEFRVQGLDEWWPFGHIGLASSFADFDLPPSTVVRGRDEQTLTISLTGEERSRAQSHELHVHVIARVDAPAGITRDSLYSEYILPLQALMTIVTDATSERHALRIWPLASTGSPSSEDPDGEAKALQVDPGVDPPPDPKGHRFPLFTADQIDAETFLGNWIKLAQTALVPMSVAGSAPERTSLYRDTVEIVNALETLDRALHPDPESSDLVDRLKIVLDEQRGSINSRERRSILSSVSRSEFTLQSRLARLVDDLGPAIAQDLFQQSPQEWAFVASLVRNAMSHGYTTAHRLERDPAAAVAIMHTGRALLRLRLLQAAGVDAAQLHGMVMDHAGFRHLVYQELAEWAELAKQVRLRN